MKASWVLFFVFIIILVGGAGAEEAAALNSSQTKAVLNWIADQVASDRQSYCYRESYGRTVGKPISACASDQEHDRRALLSAMQGRLQRRRARVLAEMPFEIHRYRRFLPKARSIWPRRRLSLEIRDGPNNKGMMKRCKKHHSGGCEMNGAIAYPKCKKGFHNVGCCICSPNCTDGMTDTGTGCTKKSYGRGAGTPLKCASDLELDGALCYPKCKSGYNGVGPVCWGKCPSGKSECGVGCADSTKSCISNTTSMVTAPLVLAVNIYTLGAAGKASSMTGKLASIKSFYNAHKDAFTLAQKTIAAIKLTAEIEGTVDLWAEDYLTVFDKMTTEKVDKEIKSHFSVKAANWVRKQYALAHLQMMMESDGMATAKNMLSGLSGFDPSGVSGVVAAYLQPKCMVDKDFPSVAPLY